ncbi:MAG: TrkH family potassium uptake protein [Natronospirillum sp.]|uniref:TrkH family potassium uptake protein n=1 Tax=Natronospirillum sp. TaxID=2812955 RepID=UPI0025CF8F0F|nr:TrkH family potassium uptake protein [Natronospirillum sp.]MCH8553243.1 TrkH family potassium uptake protein [Natronospirillum sp.]
MHYRIMMRVLGLMLMLFSVAMLPPAGISLWYDDGAFYSFGWSFVLILGVGLMLWLPVMRTRDELRTREGFMVTALFWVVLGTAGSLPLYLSADAGLTYTDAFFESFSGLTTTGATVMTGIEHLPESIRLYRQQLQWMGGMGIIVLAVAILPMLGVGGMQLYRAEMSGPMKDNKLAPRIAETAKALWMIYAGLTVACGLGYWLAGMSPFDAIGHAFSTVAIGGFSTYDGNIGVFDNGMVEAVAIVFMLLAAANFGLHFVAFRSRNPAQYLKDPEYRFFLLIIVGLIGVTTVTLWVTSAETGLRALRIGAFEATSIMTTTGFSSTGFAHFPLFLPFLLFMASFFGGCAGSTAGGMKSIRILLLWQQGVREVKRLIHPNGVFPVKVGRAEVPDRVLNAVWGYFSVYVFVFLVLLTAMLGTGLDFVTSWSAVGSAMNNLGPGLGAVASNYSAIPDTSKWLLCFAMLMGRLEIFTLIIVLSPMFWRR